MSFEAIIALSVFGFVILAFTFEWFEKASLTLLGVITLLIFQIVSFEDVQNMVDFDTLALLLGMSLLVDTACQSGLFSWVNLKITEKTKGNPLLILASSLFLTAILSSFINNLTTLMVVVPITVALTRGMGLNPKLFIIFEIIYSKFGGTLTLIGDPPNTLLGTQVGLPFMSFITNLWVPLLASSIICFAVIVKTYWSTFRPIRDNLAKLFASHLLIQKVQHDFQKEDFDKHFAIFSALAIFAGVLMMVFAEHIGLTTGYAGLLAGVIFVLAASKKVSPEHTLQKVEWSTLLFFGGLFVLVGAVEKTGVLEHVSFFIANHASNLMVMCIMILWISAIVSALLDNIPLILLMIPVVRTLIGDMDPQLPTEMLWWSLSLGACLGGNGSVIGSASNIVALDIANKFGVKISYKDFNIFGATTTFGVLIICSLYIMYRTW